MKKLEIKNDVEKLVALGKQKGFLTYDEVNNILPEELTSDEEIDQVFGEISERINADLIKILLGHLRKNSPEIILDYFTVCFDKEIMYI